MSYEKINFKTGQVLDANTLNKIDNQVAVNELKIATKQDIINDLDSIRIGAQLGSTAIQQHQSLTGLATETYVDNKVATVVNSSSQALNTLEELSQALSQDSSLSTTLMTQIGKKQDIISDLNSIRIGAARGATALQTHQSLTGYATENYVDVKVADLVGSAPESLNTLQKLSEALANNEDIATTILNQVSSKQDLINDLGTIRSGAELGTTALQSFTETDPTVPDWAKAETKPSYNAAEITGLSNLLNNKQNNLVADTDYLTPTTASTTYEPKHETIVTSVNGNSGDVTITLDTFSTTANGLVPKPETADETKYLTAAGTWVTGTMASGTVAVDTTLTKSGYAADAKTVGDKLTGLATEEFVSTKVADLVNSTPETLNTLQELSDALAEDSNMATTITTEIGTKISADQGTENAGKIMVVNNEGKLEAVDASTISASTTVDTTLTISGQAADAKIVGEKLTEKQDKLDTVVTSINGQSGTVTITVPETPSDFDGSKSGLVPKPSEASTTMYLTAAGTWAQGTVTGENAISIDTSLTVANAAADAKTVGEKLALKQDTINDLDAIRSGALLGTTAIQQHQSLSGLATQTYVDTKIADLATTAPETLATLQQLSQELAKDNNMSTTITTELSKKVNVAQGADNVGKVLTVNASGNLEPANIVTIENGGYIEQDPDDINGGIIVDASTTAVDIGTFSSTTNGLVPAPGTDNTDKFLKGDGTWAEVSSEDYLTKENPTSTGSLSINKATDTDTTSAIVVNNETFDTNKNNTFTLDWDGNAVFAGTVTSNGQVLANGVQNTPVTYTETFSASSTSSSSTTWLKQYTSDTIPAGLYLIILDAHCINETGTYRIGCYQDSRLTMLTSTSGYSSNKYIGAGNSCMTLLNLTADDKLAVWYQSTGLTITYTLTYIKLN